MDAKTQKKYNKIVAEFRKKGYLTADKVADKTLKEAIDKWLVYGKQKSQERIKDA
ncbi:MAG: hypothetical protein WCO56_08240 [Verrucomicrobiota bacterium]